MIGIITINNDTFTNPTLFALISKLNDEGQEIALFNNRHQHFVPSGIKNVHFFDSPRGFQFPKRPDNFLSYLQLYWKIIKVIRAKKISDIIAVDPVGLILAGRIAKMANIRIHYFSFEIFFADEVRTDQIYQRLKKKEILYTKSVSSIVIQDEERQKKLINENDVSEGFDNWYLIPVAPSLTNSNKKYHRSAYGISMDDTVYVHSGSIAEWAGINQIIKAVETGLPAKTKIFVHSRSRFDPANPIHQKLFQLRESNPGLILHDEIFGDYGDYMAFLQIFDYGLVLYEPDGGIFTGKNISSIGLSSGKFSTYMAVGLPSLLFDCNAYRRIVKEYAIGAIVSATEDLSFHLSNNSLYNMQRETCTAFYREKLDPESNINSFITKELMIS